MLNRVLYLLNSLNETLEKILRKYGEQNTGKVREICQSENVGNHDLKVHFHRASTSRFASASASASTLKLSTWNYCSDADVDAKNGY